MIFPQADVGISLFTDDWARAWAEKLSASDVYRTAASKWEGDIVLVMEPDDGLGIAERQTVYLDLWHGDCREARVATVEDEQGAAYVISASAVSWKEILEGSLDPIMALMRGRLTLKKGRLASLLPYTSAAKELVASAREVETTFPEGWRG